MRRGCRLHDIESEAKAVSPHRHWFRPFTRPGVAVTMSVTGMVLLILVGAGAPNNNTLRLPLPIPPQALMPDLAATLATFASITLSSLGTMGMLGAHRRGWSPSPRKLFGLGALAVAVVVNLTPVGSSDTASYAAYGRISALGGDPYTTTPAQLGGTYAHWVGNAWLNSPSVYGPAATWLQTTAAQIGGHRPWLTIWLFMLANGAVFLTAGYVLLRMAPDPVRAALIWVANPVLIVELVAGGHLDTLVAALAVGAIAVAGQAPGCAVTCSSACSSAWPAASRSAQPCWDWRCSGPCCANAPGAEPPGRHPSACSSCSPDTASTGCTRSYHSPRPRTWSPPPRSGRPFSSWARQLSAEVRRAPSSASPGPF